MLKYVCVWANLWYNYKKRNMTEANMNSKERIELFLKYQNEKMSFEDISKKLEIKPDTLRRT